MQAFALDWETVHVQLSKADSDVQCLVFMNSLGTDVRMWGKVCARLPADWSTWSMDKRGHGLSDTGPDGYGISGLAQDVLAAMDHAKIERAVLASCSIGGQIAQHVALTRQSVLLG